MTSTADRLPPLRDDLSLAPGARERTGEVRWTLHDPLRNKYYSLTDHHRQILSHWALASVRRIQQQWAQAGETLDARDVLRLREFLVRHQLVTPEDESSLREHHRQTASHQRGGPRWWLARFMSTRWVLGHPNDFLVRTLPWVSVLFTWPAIMVWCTLTGFGIWLVTRQWDAATRDVQALLSWEGGIYCGLALAGLKLIHELGHGWAAVRFGLPVPSMGVSFSFGFPMLYTDTTATHRLRNQRERILIGLAGVGAESIIAGIATFVWAVMPDSVLRDIALVIATTSWVTSVAVNLNPLGRFDGYYLLSDYLRIENLQTRAKRYAGWVWSTALVGRSQLPPETVSRRRAWFYTAYGTACVLYSVSIYLGICTLLWLSLPALVSLPLITAILVMLCTQPVKLAFRKLLNNVSRVPMWRKAINACLLASVAALIFLPLDEQVAIPAVLGWSNETQIVSADAALITEVKVQPGARVKEGDLILALESPDLKRLQETARIHLELATTRSDRKAADPQDQRELQVIEAQRQESQSELAGLAQRMQQLEVRASEDGWVVDLDPGMQEGRWLRPGQLIARLLQGQSRDVRGLVAQHELTRLRAGTKGRFIPDDPVQPAVEVTLLELKTTAEEVVFPEFLSSNYGGDVKATTDPQGREIPERAHVAARFAPSPSAALPPDPILVRGVVHIQAQPRSLFDRAFNHVWRVINNELRQ